MSIILKSGSSSDLMTVDPVSKAARVSMYDSSGALIVPAGSTVVGTPAPASAVVIAGEGQDGNVYHIRTDNNGFLRLDSGGAPDTAAPNRALQVAGSDGTNLRTLSVSATGILKIDGSAVTQPISGSVSVSNFPATQPVSAASLPLPSGAATSALQTTGNSSLSSIDTKTPTLISGLGPVIVKRNPLLGLYLASSGILTIQAAAHAATAGFMWLINPIGSGVTVYLRKMNFTSATTTALLTLTSPRVTMERITFTGTASGTTITSGKRASADATPKGIVLLSSTGLTITAGAIMSAFAVVNNQTAASTTQPAEQVFDTKDDDGLIVLAPGEGLVFRQPDAGTTSDTRKVNIDIKWEER